MLSRGGNVGAYIATDTGADGNSTVLSSFFVSSLEYTPILLW